MSNNKTHHPSFSRRNFLTAASSAVVFNSIAVASGAARSISSSNDFAQNFQELPDNFIYLNSGTEGTMPQIVLENYKNNLYQWASNPTFSYELDPILGKHQHINRTRVAKFLNVKKNNICLTDNTTMGLSMTLMGLNFSSSDKVIMTNHEHNAISGPLQLLHDRMGLKVITRNFPPSKQLALMNETELLDVLLPDSKELRGAKALCVSHVYPTTGVRLPLKALRTKVQKLGIKYLIVDGAQAMGMIDISRGADHIAHCDFYACPGHKWLNGPPSTGILYIKNAHIKPPEFYPTLSQRMGKYSGCEQGTDCHFPMTEALQVRGCSNATGFAAMTDAMTFINNAGGASQVEKYILILAGKMKSFLLQKSPLSLISPSKSNSLLTGITAFFPFSWHNPHKIFKDKKTASHVVSTLLKKNIQIRYIGFHDGKNDEVYALRVSTALFNDDQQLKKFQHELKKVLQSI
ncbi:MAG TPA: aminotransferase class V-fold PLP-dependent enzyme [Aeromonadales bacterium]|nr:aminotransferase class V-fold PLP-dependent enzyme [Aeromonadales bacterium]